MELKTINQNQWSMTEGVHGKTYKLTPPKMLWKARWEERSLDFVLLMETSFSSSQAPIIHADSTHELLTCSHRGG